MKNVILSLFILLLCAAVSAQEVVYQPKYALKTSLLTYGYRNIKFGLDIARSNRETVEVQLGTVLTDVTGRVSRRAHSHLLMRYKYDIIPDDKNVSGVYIAPGIEMGQWKVESTSQGNPVYLNLLFDVGAQTNIGSLNIEIFGGVGFTWLDGAEFSKGTDTCWSCDYDLAPNSLNAGPIAFRLGSRMGINF